MRPLSNRSESDSNSILDGETESSEDSFGWDDESSSELDIYLKNKKLESRLIQLANEKISLAKIFQKYQISFKQQYSPSGWTHKSLCPFKDHNEKTPSFSFNPEENRFNCFGCQRGGKAVQFISYMEDLPAIQVAKELLGRILHNDEIISEIGENDISFKIRDLLFDYANYVAEFVDKHNQSKDACKYAEVITWPLDAYVRNHMSTDTIVLEQLEGRINILKEHLDAYGEDEE